MDPVYTLAWHQTACRVMPRDLPMAAAELLAAGEDSPALRELAGRSGRGLAAEMIELLHEALAELGLPVPTWETAHRCELREAAERVAAGEVTPEELVEELQVDRDAEFPEAEGRFANLYIEVDCGGCLEDLGVERLADWTARVRSAAAELASAADDPRVGPARL
ncbi:hypothetical protein [Kitasatospora sp. NPDC101183]|uniref:hypothetical protein n=1 Tax=Kitasatospora sp. NPDC101183 TaxID=3364100 RepID=UPI0038055BC1